MLLFKTSKATSNLLHGCGRTTGVSPASLRWKRLQVFRGRKEESKGGLWFQNFPHPHAIPDLTLPGCAHEPWSCGCCSGAVASELSTICSKLFFQFSASLDSAGCPVTLMHSSDHDNSLLNWELYEFWHFWKKKTLRYISTKWISTKTRFLKKIYFY